VRPWVDVEECPDELDGEEGEADGDEDVQAGGSGGEAEGFEQGGEGWGEEVVVLEEQECEEIEGDAGPEQGGLAAFCEGLAEQEVDCSDGEQDEDELPGPGGQEGQRTEQQPGGTPGLGSFQYARMKSPAARKKAREVMFMAGLPPRCPVRRGVRLGSG